MRVAASVFAVGTLVAALAGSGCGSSFGSGAPSGNVVPSALDAAGAYPGSRLVASRGVRRHYLAPSNVAPGRIRAYYVSRLTGQGWRVSHTVRFTLAGEVSRWAYDLGFVRNGACVLVRTGMAASGRGVELVSYGGKTTQC